MTKRGIFDQRLYWWFLLSAICFAFVLTKRNAASAAQTPTVDLVLAEGASAPAKFGAEEIRHALEGKGQKVLVTARPSAAAVHVFVGQRGDAILPKPEKDRLKVPDEAESYSISRTSEEEIVVEGSDATGVMYGALDLAEQIGWTEGDRFVDEIRPVSKSPYLPIRGINMFPTTQDIDDPNGAFWSDEFWTRYFDMMARNRYNFLDIHGPSDATAGADGFPDGFSYFISLPDFPEVGVGPERARKNLSRFRQVVLWAVDRGIKVGYMNYSAAPPIGPWKSGRFGKDNYCTIPPQQSFLTGPRLEEYTREAVTSFLKQLPELWIFGFRVGESGQPEDFYKKTYLAVLKDVATGLNIYLRTWITDPQKVREIGDSTPHHLFIEPKFNGEHLGLPYQAVLGERLYVPSGSYEDYTNYPRNYSIIWQIRAEGTHRVFYWGSPEFARRTVESCKFGDGVGFSMESPHDYYPEADYIHNNPKTDHNFYKWMFEREWFWNLVWGRTAYDPEVSERVWLTEFEARFGRAAGPRVYNALVESSKIVPFIFAYHNIGLDHEDFAPEFETGDHALGVRQERGVVPYGGNSFDFLRVGTLDRTAMADPVTYVDDYLNNRPSGKMTPLAAAAYLASAADASERESHEAAKLNPLSQKEFECLQWDVEAVASLARYYRDRILSATHLEFYRRTNHRPELRAAREYLQRALEDWDRLSDITETHYGYVPELIRLGVNQFRWRDEGRSLGVDLDQIGNMEAEFQKLGERSNSATIIGHVPPLKLRPGETLKLDVTYATARQEENPHLFLFYRNSQQIGYTKVVLYSGNKFERTWKGEIPGEVVVPGYLEYYFEGDRGEGETYGGTLAHRPPYRVPVNDNDCVPVISHIPPTTLVRSKAITLSAKVEAKAKISSVGLYYKQMPANYEWVRLEMEKMGNDRYQATVPLTPEGILYYFEASDGDGNAVSFPDFQKRTPYFVIKGWDARETSAKTGGLER